MNLKERLTSTENLLRSIRGGEVPASAEQAPAAKPAAPAKGSIWTRQISLGNVFARRDKGARPQPDAPAAVAPLSSASADPAAPKAAPASTPAFEIPAAVSAAPSRNAELPFWKRPIRLRRNGKALSIGVSASGSSLRIAAINVAGGTLVAARRFPMKPSQAPGEKDFVPFWRACLVSMGLSDAGADVWAVLRSADMDLNVLSVPKLSGGKLDAAVYWTLQKEKKFAEAEYVLDYIVLGPTAETKENKLDVLTCLARRADVERVQNAFREAGCQLAGVTAIPSAFLGLYRRRGAPGGYALAANIHVEPDFSAIGLYGKDRLVFSRFIRSGGGSMVDTIVEHFQELAKPKAIEFDDLELLPLPDVGEAEPAPEEPAQTVEPLDFEQAQALMRHVLLGGPKPDFATPAHLLSPTELIDIIAPAIERLARQVERTLDYFASSKQMRCDALHLSGEIFGSPAIAQALAGQLGLTPTVFDATQFFNGGEAAAPRDRMTLAPALAAALSQPERGINLTANYKTRTALVAKRAVTSRLLMGMAGLLLLIGGAGFFLDRGLTAKRQELAQLRNRIQTLGPGLDESALQASVTLFKTHQAALREAAARLLAPAALTEVAARLPENVRIVNFTAEYPTQDEAKPAAPQPGQPAPPQAPPQPAAGQKAAPKTSGVVSLEGVVTGDRAEFDASLARFVLSLQSSPMFSMPVVTDSGLRDMGDGSQVLYFSMRLGVK